MSGTGAAGLMVWLADWLPLALAGGVGAACRWSMDSSVNSSVSRMRAAASTSSSKRRRCGRSPSVPMPWGTVVVNVTACLLMGLLVGWTGSTPDPGSRTAAALSVLGTGFLGGYSTFSTACVEGARLLLAGRWGPALTHAALMTTATLGAVGLGLSAGAALR
ncbi:CrcB family protein [Actinomyces sp. ZJ308]|uniref:fluoride efflux transporter FluC n=1 Tax=Actinomyces sp. ZJ308 TaxID=2708342 RepID=UPI0014236839|nr:CrcB family protein [Actinomyces sp. ZJ308]